MKTRLRAALAVSILMLGLGLMSTSARAQDGPTITVEPATVPAAGDHEITVTGEGWSTAAPFLVLLCPVPDSGEAADVDSASCDISNPFQYAINDIADGSFTGTFTLTVPEGGLGILVGETSQSETATAIVAIGEGDGELAETGAESTQIAVIGASILAAGALLVGGTRRRR